MEAKFEHYHYEVVAQNDAARHQACAVNSYLDNEHGFQSKEAAIEMKDGRDDLEVETFAVFSNVML